MTGRRVRPARRRSAARALGIALLVLVLLGSAGAIAWRGGVLDGGAAATPTATKVPSPPPTPVRTIPPRASPVLAGAAHPATPATPTGVRVALAGALRSPTLGTSVSAMVLDVSTGSTLLDRAGATPHTPASVQKLLVGSAVLTTLGPDAVVRTTVVADAGEPTRIVLVGGGDATLTAGARVRGSPAASLRVLADRTAAALRDRGMTSVALGVDDSLFAGPGRNAAWPTTYVTSGVVAPVSALEVDGARVRPGKNTRALDPGLDAGRRFAALLAARGVKVLGRPTRTPSSGGDELAAVSGPPMSELVERMLTTSDDDLAEALSRLVGSEAAGGGPATALDGTAAVVAAVEALGVRTTGVSLLDGSGLARGNRIPVTTLVDLLGAAAGAEGTALRPLLSGLPVAGFTGTLADRYAKPELAPGRGDVRAKTGTLTGVSSLAGIVVTRAGQVLAFAVIADAVPATGTLAARATLDRMAAALAQCGCA